MKKVAFFVVLLSLPLLAFIVLAVPSPNADNTAEKVGIVTNVFEGGEKDIVFKLSGEEEHFYINRGLESGLDINTLMDQLIGREVLFVYPKRNTGMGIKHLYHVQAGDHEIYSEYPEFIPNSLHQ